MTCRRCESWAATTRAALDHRLTNMAAAPQVGVYSCPHCFGTDWATTEEFLREEPPRPPSRWQRLMILLWGRPW